jgi:hypothetical protein
MGWTYNRAYRAVKIGERVRLTVNRQPRGSAVVLEKTDWPLQTLTFRLDEGYDKTINNTFRSVRFYPSENNSTN